MGAGPSLAKFLKSMDDEDLSKLVEDAYRLEPQRMEKIFSTAKTHYFEDIGEKQPPDPPAVDTTPTLNMPAPLLPPGAVVTAPAPAPAPTPAPASSPPAAALSEMLQAVPSSAPATTAAPSGPAAVPPAATSAAIEAIADSVDEPTLSGVKDPMNALWSFEGHRLCKLRPASQNPQQKQQGSSQVETLRDGAPAGITARELDEDGHPVLYGHCGRDKRYARCSVCYFRGVRRNSAHYCNCCQRPVCIRPRDYPGEEHPKICWNVLHMDKDMIQRVEKKKKRKLQTMLADMDQDLLQRVEKDKTDKLQTVAAAASVSSVLPFAPPSTRLSEPVHSSAVSGANSRPDGGLEPQSGDLQRAVGPTVVADVKGSVNL